MPGGQIRGRLISGLQLVVMALINIGLNERHIDVKNVNNRAILILPIQMLLGPSTVAVIQ